MSPRHAVLLSIVFLTFPTGQTLLGEPSEPAAPDRTDHYGDPLPTGARFRLGTIRLRHDGPVTALSWLPDGRTLASSGMDNTIYLWQIPGGKQVAKREGQGIFSSDGRTWICRDQDKGTYHVFDLASGKELRQIRRDHCPGNLSLDGKFSVVVEAKGVRLFDVDSGKEIRLLEGKLNRHKEGPSLMFAPDSRFLIGDTEDGVCCWSIQTGVKHYALGEEWPLSFAFSPDAKMLATAGRDGSIRLRSWPACKELRRLEMEENYERKALSFSPDGKLLALGQGGAIRLWDPATGEQLRRFQGHGYKDIHALAFAPDGSLLASAGADNAVIVWEVRAEKSPRPLTGVGRLVDLVGLAADGQALLTRSPANTLTVWDIRNGRPIRTLPDGADSIDSFRFGPDASRKRALLRQEMEKRRQRPGFSKESFSYYANTAFSPDNTLLAIGSVQDGKSLLLHKTAEGIVARHLDDDAPVAQAKKRGFLVAVSQLTFAPDGRTLAVTYSDGRLILWNPHTGRARHILALPRHGEPYRSMAFSADGRLLAVSDRHVLYVVETASGQSFWKRPLGEHWIDSLAFAPDNRTLAIGDAGPLAAIHLWDLPTNKEFHTLQGDQYSIEKLILSADGTFLLSGGYDKTVLCWDVAAILRRRISSKELSAVRLSELWIDLACKDAPRGQRAVAELIQAPDAALPFLEKSVPPLAPSQMNRIANLIADLDSEQFTRRERASAELAKLGDSIAPALSKVLTEKPSLEMRRRIEALLEVIDAQQISPEGLGIRTIRALQVLETIGTTQARHILEGLARGAAEATLTHQAKATLRRLHQRLAKQRFPNKPEA